MNAVQNFGLTVTLGICAAMIVLAIGFAVRDIVRAIDRHADAMSDCLDEPEELLGEAIEWETDDGLKRTTDKRMASGWAHHFTVRVVRRAPIKETTP